jgi:hypothetical protein
MYNLDQVTHKQIKVRRTFMKVCEFAFAFNPYNSVTKYIFFFICFENLPSGIPSTHTYIPLMCVGHE